MTSRNSQCPTCGHLYNDEHPYYSEDFASYYSRKSVFALTWCYHCTSISTYVQPWLAKIFRAPALRLKSTVLIKDIDSKALFHKKENEMGLFAGAHLMRMVWHCLNSRASLESDEKNQMERAVHLALKKLPPREVALMAYITIKAPEFVPLELQIEEGKYLGSEDHIQLSTMQSWISSSTDTKMAEITLEVLAGFDGN